MPAFTLISSVPPCITSEEHRNVVASTPSSFNDISPVLRHKEGNVSVLLDPPLDGFTSEDCATGTLYIIESVLAFISSTGNGFQIEYPSITLHAVSRAESGPSIYCQIDAQAEAGGENFSDMTELNLIPQRPDALEPIFEALSYCASLHPDLHESDDDDEVFIDANEPGFEVFTGDEGQELSEVGRAALEHLESIIVHSDERKQPTEKVGDDGGIADTKI